MRFAASVSLFFLARIAAGGFLLGPELPMDKRGAADIASLLTPDAAFAIFRERDRVTLIPMREGGIERSIPCAGIPVAPWTRLRAEAAGPRGALFMCTGEFPVAAHFVSIDGAVSDPILIPVPFGPYSLRSPVVYWTGRDFAVLLAEYASKLWVVRFSADGALTGAPELIVPFGSPYLAVLDLTQTSVGPLLFETQLNVVTGIHFGSVYAFSLTNVPATETGRIMSAINVSVAWDGASHVLAAWVVTKADPYSRFVYVTMLGDLDFNGNPVDQQEVASGPDWTGLVESVGWDGAEFILVTTDARIAAVSNGTETPQFTALITGASGAYVLSANGRAAIVYKATRSGVEGTFYRWVSPPRHRAARQNPPFQRHRT